MNLVDVTPIFWKLMINHGMEWGTPFSDLWTLIGYDDSNFTRFRMGNFTSKGWRTLWKPGRGYGKRLLARCWWRKNWARGLRFYSFWHAFFYPIGSMYAIYGNIYHQYTPNVSIYTSTMDPMGTWLDMSLGVIEVIQNQRGDLEQRMVMFSCPGTRKGTPKFQGSSIGGHILSTPGLDVIWCNYRWSPRVLECCHLAVLCDVAFHLRMP